MQITGLLDSVSRMAATKPQTKMFLETFLRNGERDGADKDYLTSLDQAIKILDESNNLQQFRQRVRQQMK